MAEERLIDADKDKKYKIRKNAEGEDELYVDESAEEEPEPETSFEAPEIYEDDEEAAVLTPEQLAERERRKAEEKAAREKKAEEYCRAADEKLDCDPPDFEGALYNFRLAVEVCPESGEGWAGELSVLSRGFSDYTAIDECVECSEKVKEYCSDEQKRALFSQAADMRAKLDSLEGELSALSSENEQKKAERREIFADNKRRSVRFFAYTATPFLAFLIMIIACLATYFGNESTTGLVLLIVAAALSFIGFILTVISSKKLWAAQSKVSLNEKNSSTKLGRRVEKLTAEVESLRAIISAITVESDDIS